MLSETLADAEAKARTSTVVETLVEAHTYGEMPEVAVSLPAFGVVENGKTPEQVWYASKGIPLRTKLETTLNKRCGRCRRLIVRPKPAYERGGFQVNEQLAKYVPECLVTVGEITDSQLKWECHLTNRATTDMQLTILTQTIVLATQESQSLSFSSDVTTSPLVFGMDIQLTAERTLHLDLSYAFI